MRDERLARGADDRYLELLKGALLDEHYLENEVRSSTCSPAPRRGRPVDPEHAPRPRRAPCARRRPAARAGAPGRRATDGDRRHVRTSRTPTMGATAARPPRAVRCDTIRDATASPATSSSAAPAAAAARSTCAASSRPTSSPDRTVWVADRFRAAPDDAGAPPSTDGVADLPRRPQPGARRLRPLRPARRPGALPARAPSPTRCPTPDRRGSRCCGIGAGVGRRRRRRRSSACTPRLALGGFVIVEARLSRRCRDAVDDVPRPTRHRRAARAHRCRPASRGARSADIVGRAAGPRRQRRRADRVAARPTGAERRARPLGRRRLLQHAARGGPHAALAVARLPARASTTSTTR